MHDGSSKVVILEHDRESLIGGCPVEGVGCVTLG